MRILLAEDEPALATWLKFALTGKELDAFIKDRMTTYRQLAKDFNLKVAQ